MDSFGGTGTGDVSRHVQRQRHRKRELVDDLPEQNLTVRMLRMLDSVAPGQWKNLVGFEHTIKALTGEKEYLDKLKCLGYYVPPEAILQTGSGNRVVHDLALERRHRLQELGPAPERPDPRRPADLVPGEGEALLWAVSQAAPYRRMQIEGDIRFDKGSWASGGLLANSIVEGRAGLTTGQQWFTRNSQLGSWEGGNWNRVFVGVEGAPPEEWPEKPTTVIDTTPVIREKPFLTLDSTGEFAVFVPALNHNTRGVSWDEQPEAGKLIPIAEFHIAKAAIDDAASINRALNAGKHILFTPGIYHLNDSIVVNRPDTVLLGLGLPTFIPQTGKVAFKVNDVAGVALAGLMVDAGPQKSPTLFEIGKSNSDADNSANPITLHDIFCRIGGAVDGEAEVCVTINSDHVIADHFWLWRADHGIGYEWQDNNSSAHGLVVNGDDVTVYGLFNEHFQHYQTLWNGERGRTYFYQSEIPYSPPSNETWNDEGKAGFASYKVADHVQEHQAWGLGIYSFFRGDETVASKVRLENAIECPAKPGIEFTHIATFAGLNGGINHVINGLGPATEVGELKLYDGFKGVSGER